MKQILFVSSTEVSPQLELCLSEFYNKGFRFITISDHNRVISNIKTNNIDTVVINSFNRKLESYELAKEIKDYFKSSIRVFVYLADSNLNEASKFGLVNAEVEDDKTIFSLINKINIETEYTFHSNENITCIYGLNGGIGSSTIALILAEYISKNSKVILAETTNNFSLKSYLNVDTGHAILSRNHWQDLKQSKDIDWFRAFLNETLQMPNLLYLNIFNNLNEKQDFHLKRFSKLEEINESIKKIFLELKNNNEVLFTKQELSNSIQNSYDSLKLLCKELSGEALSSMYDILQLGSQITDSFIFDIGSDPIHNFNRQILKTTKKLIIVFKDNISLKKEYLAHKEYFEKEFKLKVIPILVPDPYQSNSYKNFSKNDWENLIDDVPIIYPYCPEIMSRFIFDHEPLTRNKKINQFARILNERIQHKQNFERQNSNLLKLREKKSLINWG